MRIKNVMGQNAGLRVVMALGALVGVAPLSGCDSEDEEPAQSASGAGTRDAGADAGKQDSSAPSGDPSGETKPDAASASDDGKALYVTGSVVLADDGQLSYLSLLPNLDKQKIDLKQAREFAGWSGFSVSEGKLFVSNGEAPIMTRFDVDDDGKLTEDKSVSFLNHGAEYADSAFVAPDKAYVFASKVVVWDPRAMVVKSTFDLPVIEDRQGGLEFTGIGSGRQFAKRGNRAYFATSWANWETYRVAEESLIVVLDTENDKVLKTIPVPCPYLDVASTGDDGSVYFSNWVFSVDQTLTQGKKKACAVRLLPDQDELDPDWTLTFADVTDGREGAALQYLGDGKAMFVAYHAERVEDLEAQKEPGELALLNNWRFWLLDVESKEAKPIESIDWNAGGFSSARVDGRSFVLVPNADYESTTVVEVLKDGSTEERWTIDGWSMDIKRIR